MREFFFFLIEEIVVCCNLEWYSRMWKVDDVRYIIV